MTITREREKYSPGFIPRSERNYTEYHPRSFELISGSFDTIAADMIVNHRAKEKGPIPNLLPEQER
jgi:hypothetical protein